MQTAPGPTVRQPPPGQVQNPPMPPGVPFNIYAIQISHHAVKSGGVEVDDWIFPPNRTTPGPALLHLRLGQLNDPDDFTTHELKRLVANTGVPIFSVRSVGLVATCNGLRRLTNNPDFAVDAGRVGILAQGTRATDSIGSSWPRDHEIRDGEIWYSEMVFVQGRSPFRNVRIRKQFLIFPDSISQWPCLAEVRSTYLEVGKGRGRHNRGRNDWVDYTQLLADQSVHAELHLRTSSGLEYDRLNPQEQDVKDAWGARYRTVMELYIP